VEFFSQSYIWTNKLMQIGSDWWNCNWCWNVSLLTANMEIPLPTGRLKPTEIMVFHNSVSSIHRERTGWCKDRMTYKCNNKTHAKLTFVSMLTDSKFSTVYRLLPDTNKHRSTETANIYFSSHSRQDPMTYGSEK